MRSLPNNRKAAPSSKTARSRQKTPVPPRRRLPLRWRIRRFIKKRLSALPYLLPEAETVWKIVFISVLLLIFVLLQTTVFSRFRPFGAVPDLMLSLVIAVSMSEGEKWGTGTALAGAFLLEALGSTGPTLLPVLYVAAGCFCPLITDLYLTDSVPVRILYTVGFGLGRSLFTLLYLALHVPEFPFPFLLTSVLLPEYAATLALALLPHLAAKLLLRPFHRSRAERTGSL